MSILTPMMLNAPAKGLTCEPATTMRSLKWSLTVALEEAEIERDERLGLRKVYEVGSVGPVSDSEAEGMRKIEAKLDESKAKRAERKRNRTLKIHLAKRSLSEAVLTMCGRKLDGKHCTTVTEVATCKQCLACK